MEKFVEYAPIIIVVLMFFIQNKIFVKPEDLEKKHREILEDCDKKLKDEVVGKYVELNAYKEFQSHINLSLETLTESVNEVKNILISKGKDL